MSKYFLGLDGGATKTDAVVVDELGNEVSRGSADGANASVIGYKSAVANVSGAVREAIKNFKIQTSFLAIAGIDTSGQQSEFVSHINSDTGLKKLIGNFRVENDVVAALRSGSNEKNAIALVAGTGSNCWGKNEKGYEAKSGGVNYILSDEGSAYWIGLAILKSVTKSLDGRGELTGLKDLLFEKYSLKSLEDLVSLVYKKPWDKADIGLVAPLAELAAKDGDNQAMKIINKAALDLAQMVKAVANKLNLKEIEYTIVTVGSVFKIKNLLFERLSKEVVSFSPKAKFVRPSMDSATAAGFLAMEQK